MNHQKHPPGPKGHWLTGNVRQFRHQKLDFYTRCAQEFGDVSSFRLGPKRLTLLAHPDDIERVLVTENRNFVKHYVLRLLRPVLGNGLLLSEGDFWLRQRRLMQPIFSRQRIESFVPVMVEFAKRYADRWQAGESLDIHAEMTALALEIACKTLLDVDVSDEVEVVQRNSQTVMADFSRRFESAGTLPPWVPTPRNLKCRRAIRKLHAVIHRMIAERRNSGEDRGDLLSTLLRARDEDGRGMTDRQLRDEVMTFFLAGHETTANALTWTWYVLAQHPEVEQKLVDELRTVLGDRDPTAADLPRLIYTERVVRESMRLYPPAYAFGRLSTEPTEFGSFKLPAGSTFLVSQWVTHRDPRWFDDPEEFNPDRWTPEFEKQLPPYAYFPFGGGPRICIGNTFATMEATLIVATIASRWRIRLESPEPVKPWPSVTLRPSRPIRVILEQRAPAENLVTATNAS